MMSSSSNHGLSAPAPVPPAGRVALVTGGAGPIGAAVVEALAGRGWAVAIHAHRSLAAARDTAERLSTRGVSALAVTANLREEGTVRALVHRVADHFGRIDALVACALTRRPTSFDDLTGDDLRAHFDVNCVGTFVAAQEAGAVMAGQVTGGVIVMLGDAESVRPVPGSLAAATSIGATTALMRSLAAEFAAHAPHVRVNAVLPERECAADAVARAVVSLIESGSATGVCLPVEAGASVTPGRPPEVRS